ncbi:MAG TPA: glycosyltransferase [Terriglobales bacterium]|nr:glycosyltransferase [Terriglobales bacterium]
MNRRVLFIVPAFTKGAGGAERVITTVLRHLDRSDLECHLATLQAGTGFLNDVPDGVVIHKLDVSRMRYLIGPILRLAHRIKPQTIISTVSYANVPLLVARALLPRGTRVVIREATTPSAFLKHEAVNPALWKFFYRFVYPRADRIVCLSEAMRQEFNERFGIGTEKLVHIYNPVDQARIRADAAAAPNPYCGEGPHIVAAGRLRREKGFDLLIDALPLVRRDVPGAQVTILGEGPEARALKEQVRGLGLDSAVHFAGFQQNPFNYFTHADVFVLPSRLEGMPNALLEALALDTPVVATECVEAIRELHAIDDRIVTTKSENPEVLARAIVGVLRDYPTPRQRSLQSARGGRGRAEHRAEGWAILSPSSKPGTFDPLEIAARYKDLL